MTPSAEISKLVGTWEVTGERPAGSTFLSTIRIDERGAYVAHVVVGGGAVTKTADMEGIFQVVDGVLVDTQTKDSNTMASLPRTILYSSELICGTSDGVTRGATGYMGGLVAGGKSAVACGELLKPDRG